MLLKYFFDKALAQASYLVGCQQTNQAVIIDPARDITPYLKAAADENMTIAMILETHIHADYVSGARELADATGAALFLSGSGGGDWSYTFLDETRGDRALRDGDTFLLGNVRFTVLHTPGHTPEHVCFLLTDTLAADQAMGVFTGDCLFVGDMGRPDLLESAAGVVGSSDIGARGQFANMLRFKRLPDYLQVWPGHGAGSACGKALGSTPSSTLGYEKLFNPAFHFSDEDAFVRWLLAGQPETPPYFTHMKRINKHGAALLRELPPVERLEGFALADILKTQANVIDARPDAHDASVIGGAIRIVPVSKFNTYAGWMVDYHQPTYLIAMADAVESLVRDLRAVGIDDVRGVFTPRDVENTLTFLAQTDNDGAAALIERGALVLDVRGESEYESGHIDGAVNIPYGMLAQHAGQLPRDTPILVHCQSGVRSQIAMSVLDKLGFTNAVNLRDGYTGWEHWRQRA
jgi:hydroxyacylglutathione hydrolase